MGAQLPLGEFERPPLSGALLLRVRLDGKPQRAAKIPVVRGKRASMVAEPNWRKWRDEMVADLRELVELGHLGRVAYTGPVLAGVVAVFHRPKNARKTYTLDGVRRPYPWAWVPARVPYIGDPDHDQVVKAGVDVVKRAGLLADDTLVVGYAGGISRWHAAPGEDPHVEVSLWAA